MDWQELVPKCFLIMSNPIFLVLTTTNVFTERHTYLFEGQSRESSNDDVEDDSQEGINCLHTAALLRDFQKCNQTTVQAFAVNTISCKMRGWEKIKADDCYNYCFKTTVLEI